MIYYTIIETQEFSTHLSQIGQRDRQSIDKKLSQFFYPQLSVNPYTALQVKKLKNWVPPCWRLRIGKWRVIFSIDETTKKVYLMSIMRRKDVYR